MIGGLEGMTDLVDISESITVGNGQKIKHRVVCSHMYRSLQRSCS